MAVDCLYAIYKKKSKLKYRHARYKFMSYQINKKETEFTQTGSVQNKRK